MGFLNRERLTVYPILVIAIYLLAYGLSVALGAGRLDAFGHPIGADFLSYYAASKLISSGDPALVYEVGRFHRMAQTVIGAPVGPTPWLYPPTVLLAVGPLSRLAYFEALALWTAGSMALYWLLMRKILPADRTALLLALAFPGFMQNLLQGENGCVTAFLLGAALLLLDRRPVPAGVFLGLLSYKPHFLPLAWVALAAGRSWRALAAAAISAAGLAGLSVLALGTGVWKAFMESIPAGYALLQHGLAPLAKMATVQSALLLPGASPSVAQGAQAAASLIALAAVWISWRRDTPMPLKGSILLLGTLLVTPYGAYDYDLVLLAPVIAWLALEGIHRGWRSGEKAALAMAWLLPLLGPWIALRTKVTLGPAVLLWLLALAVARALAEIRSTPAPRAS